MDYAKINHIGTGNDLSSASEPFLFDFVGKRVGVYSCTEHEFFVAEDNKAGANPFDPLWSLDHIEELKKRTDFVIVLYHGGKEQYKGATIIYGQGNFIFDNSDNEYWQTSLLVKINDDFSITYLPLIKAQNEVRLADAEHGKRILASFMLRSNEIGQEGFIEKKYKEFADTFLEFYLSALSGKRSICFHILNKLTKGLYMKRYINITYDQMRKVRIANYIDCEAHKELLSQALINSYGGGYNF